MENEIGYQIGTKLFYVGESIVFIGMAYNFFRKPKQIMERLFKKYNRKMKYLSYVIGLGFIAISIESILKLIGVL